MVFVPIKTFAKPYNVYWVVGDEEQSLVCTFVRQLWQRLVNVEISQEVLSLLSCGSAIYVDNCMLLCVLWFGESWESAASVLPVTVTNIQRNLKRFKPTLPPWYTTWRL